MRKIGSVNFYCPNCSSPKLDWLKPGTKANDYRCPGCGFWFQLKSKKSPIGATITDGAYGAMMDAIQNDRAPNFFFLHYEITGRDAALRRPQDNQRTAQRSVPTDECVWTVRNLLLVPHFAFPPSAIIKRPPLAATARRAGWVGCNFNLSRIPADARIAIVTESRFISPTEVREQFKRVKPLAEIGIKERGWTLDVLNIVQHLGKKEFSNAEVYAFASELEKLHPGNCHIKDKIRQQLQVLRDLGFLFHISEGVWRLK